MLIAGVHCSKGIIIAESAPNVKAFDRQHHYEPDGGYERIEQIETGGGPWLRSTTHRSGEWKSVLRSAPRSVGNQQPGTELFA